MRYSHERYERECRLTLDEIRGFTQVNERGCWIWTTAVSSARYPRLKVLGSDGEVVSLVVSRLVCRLVYGPTISDWLACHHCDTPACVNPAHLYVGNAASNARDAMERGRLVRPENKVRRVPGDAAP